MQFKKSNINNVQDVGRNDMNQSPANVDMWETFRSGLALRWHLSLKNPKTQIFENIGKRKWNIFLRKHFCFDEFNHR